MAQFGEVRVDFITYTTGVAPNEGTVTTSVSGLINSPTFSGVTLISTGVFSSGRLIVGGVTTCPGRQQRQGTYSATTGRGVMQLPCDKRDSADR